MWQRALQLHPDPGNTPTSAPTGHQSTQRAGSVNRDAALEPMLEQPGDMIGAYKLLSIIGEGGFGVVWLAEQKSPIVRRVALKVIKPGMDTRAVVARFEQERQALAVMDHPSVARVFDAGTTVQGRPYFVMEYVRGESITAYCDRMRLSVRERLRLFVPVCEAVQHAHMKGVIHRDLKPSNILVTLPEGNTGDSAEGALPKVIDFGIAKAISQTLTDKTIFTEFGQIIGTPEYMSPEQADPGIQDVDTRTDVYALGAVLYELLTGALPFDSRSLRSAGYAEIQRIIREVDPPRPSTRLSGLGAERAGIAMRRDMRVEDLERELRRELEWIVLKAMRKAREERYRTPTELADDINNYLNGRPLIAGPVSAAYRARKFVRKHRAAVLTSVLFGATLLIATVVSVRFGIREAAARAEAERQRDLAETVEEFLNTDLLGSGDLDVAAATPLPELFSRAAQSVAERFESKPALEARVRRVLGKGFTALGDPRMAEEQFRRVIVLGESGAIGSADVFESRVALGEALYRQERVDDARAVIEGAIEERQHAVGADDAELLHVRNQLGGALKHAKMWDQAEVVYADVLARRQRVLPPDHADTLTTRHNLALVWLGRGKSAMARGKNAADAATAAAETSRAREYFERALGDMKVVAADKLRVLGPEAPLTLESQSEEASLLRTLGRLEEAHARYFAILPVMRRVLGERHWRTLEAEGNYALTCMNLERWAEAVETLGPTLEGYRIVRGAAYPDTVLISNWLARSLEKLGRNDQSREELLRTHRHMVEAKAEPARVQAHAGVIAGFFERTGSAEDARTWRGRAEEAGFNKP